MNLYSRFRVALWLVELFLLEFVMFMILTLAPFLNKTNMIPMAIITMCTLISYVYVTKWVYQAAVIGYQDKHKKEEEE